MLRKELSENGELGVVLTSNTRLELPLMEVEWGHRHALKLVFYPLKPDPAVPGSYLPADPALLRLFIVTIVPTGIPVTILPLNEEEVQRFSKKLPASGRRTHRRKKIK